MIRDDVARQLHDRATRGEELSVEERAQLDAWYAAQDQAEHALLGTAEPLPVDELRQQIATTLDRLEQATQQIQQLTGQNEGLRHDIVALQQQLAPLASQPAAAR